MHFHQLFLRSLKYVYYTFKEFGLTVAPFYLHYVTKFILIGSEYLYFVAPKCVREVKTVLKIHFVVILFAKTNFHGFSRFFFLSDEKRFFLFSVFFFYDLFFSTL